MNEIKAHLRLSFPFLCGCKHLKDIRLEIIDVLLIWLYGCELLKDPKENIYFKVGRMAYCIELCLFNPLNDIKIFESHLEDSKDLFQLTLNHLV